jgi:hypothetical protein
MQFFCAVNYERGWSENAQAEPLANEMAFVPQNGCLSDPFVDGIDGRAEFAEAIHVAYPQTKVQLGVVHLVHPFRLSYSVLIESQPQT